MSFWIQTNVAVPPVVMGGQCSQQLRRDVRKMFCTGTETNTEQAARRLDRIRM